MKLRVQRIGNSRGIIIPKPLLEQMGLAGEIELEVQSDALVLRKPSPSPRSGWAEDCTMLAERNEIDLVWPEFANEADASLEW